MHVCVGVGGGGPALCQQRPERLLGSAGGVGVRKGLLLSFVRGPLLQSTRAIQP